MPDNRDRLQAVALGRLESLERAGVMQLPRPAARGTLLQSPSMKAAGNTTHLASPVLVASEAETGIAVAKTKESKPAHSSAWTRGGESLFESADGSQLAACKAATLAVLQQEVAGCTRCSELATTRTQTVFGVGNPAARLCFLGEAPGADEDRLGEPFVGRGGQLLNKIIEACKLKREEVYILNMLKCRPPGNRNPLPDELTNCRPYLERQLELIQPEYICCLGAVAGQNLLGTTIAIGKLRGKLHAYRGAKVVCTYHPAYLLRNPAAKKDAWEDMKFLMREMGVDL